jgi:glycosyltransferase involved in cell wall biosynthesis
VLAPHFNPVADAQGKRGRRVTVLFCETNPDGTIGGSFYSLLYLVKGLDKTRFAPLVLFQRSHGLLDAFRAAGAETIVWEKPRPFRFAPHLPGPLALAMPLVLAVQKGMNVFRVLLWPTVLRVLFLWRRRVDLVHLNNSILRNHDWMLAARLLGRRCISHERGINEHYPPLARYLGRGLDAIICISEAVRTTMAAAGADFGNLRTIHNGLDPAEVRPKVPAAAMRARLAIPPGADVIVMLGNLKVWKGQESVVRAVDRVRRSRPLVRCLFVGDTAAADRPFEEGLRRLVAELGLESNVVFAGYHPNVADLVLLADVVVHASILPEPFGRVVLEAMACRKPVVASLAGGVTEIVDHGRTGLLFPPGDDQALAAAILELLGDPDRAVRMGEAGYARLLERFNISRNVEATEATYDLVLGAGRS